MGRMLIWLLLVGLVWWTWRTRNRPPAQPKRSAAPPPTAALRMVRCAHCGVHLPAQDSVEDAQGQVYCSSAHRALGAGPQA
jgi:uncharacterized protein